MKKNDVYDSLPGYWKTTDLENMFDINADVRDRLWFNLNEGLYVSAPDGAVKTYECQYAEMHWPLISYVLYGTTRLAWLLMKLNGVGVEDMFLPKKSSEKVKYVGKELLAQLIRTINGYSQ